MYGVAIKLGLLGADEVKGATNVATGEWSLRIRNSLV
jgi:hypothetical protein